MRIRRDRDGVSTVEFALVAPILAFLAVNVFDVAIYFYTAMQVANAAEMAAQSAWEACDPNDELPATLRCNRLNTAVQAAVGSTTLGAQVQLVNGFPRESYYCLIGGTLQKLEVALEPKPENCAALGAANVKPGDYIEVQVTYDYAPILSWSVAAFWPDPIVRSAMMRLL
jgi:Flp pilus assembly protein TadG